MIEFNITPEMITLGLSIVAGTFGVLFRQGKQKISELRSLIEEIDDAAKDDQVTEEEFQAIRRAAMALITK